MASGNALYFSSSISLTAVRNRNITVPDSRTMPIICITPGESMIAILM
jgi:hypothetical protein